MVGRAHFAELRLTNVRECLSKPGPELRVSSAAARTRIVSVAGIRLDPGMRHFKGIFCDDISEFESSNPSHAVRSLWLIYGTSKNARHSTRLARLKRAAASRGVALARTISSVPRLAPFAKKRFVDHTVCDTTIG